MDDDEQQIQVAYRKARYTLIVLSVLYGLVALSGIESFWPFSVQSMTDIPRSVQDNLLAQQVPLHAVDEASWQAVALDSLSDEALDLGASGIDVERLSHVVLSAEVWTEERKQDLRHLLLPALAGHTQVLLYHVDRDTSSLGRITATCRPVVSVSRDTVRVLALPTDHNTGT